ncbi:hypothetical protein HO173_007617 [Letharia columbiana]|uniref:Uncharacterized protein n=1 Tax=Letharia columbiana TaxID=112416 RepID=A0A8H6L3J0_9LECA|nr:uncharacterized protein HO173_007617 [Letharia columbiana]KAF6234197.1 hypothetical protein HO173_007617 [Letharia columbiana]
MAPPPITPSPHRFITSKPANPAPKPSSSLRFQQGAPQSISSQRFTPAPRFNFSSTQKPTTENAAVATQHASPLSRRPHLAGAIRNRSREDIEETGSDNEETEGLENDESTFARPTQPTSKRRRPNPPEAVIISSESSSPSPPPTTPPYPTIEGEDHEAVSYNDLNPHAQPRFVLPRPKSTGTPSIPSRPPLILPPRSPSPTTATPAFFSPHRRGQKYIPGGLASSVRDWIVETSQQVHNRSHARRGEEEFWDMRFRAGECRAEDPNEGMILVQERSGAKRWMLVGKGRGETKAEVGCIVGIREPTWEVQVGHENYMVAVEWKVLNG